MPAVDPLSQPNKRRHSKMWLRKTLRLSHQEAAASSVMTATGDNFFNAFAVHLNATATQMGWLTAFPQLVGAFFQLISVWLGSFCQRRMLVVCSAALQSLVVALIGLLAAVHSSDAMHWLIILAMFYHGSMNLIQPQWRAWMGSIVPPRRRGAIFASRTRLTMVVTLLVFFVGGALLSLSEDIGKSWLGFCLLFSLAALGRMVSARLLSLMHDPDPKPHGAEAIAFISTLKAIKKSLHEPVFRHYSFFVAGMLGLVAISAPFFSVYMLRDLEFTYLQYSLNSIASIATQFITLRFWGRFSDRYGNRLVMIATSCFLPSLPVLWIFSESFYYLLLVQILSGFAWSGFSLSTANYLYDIRPHKSNFSTYAATQSAVSACCVFFGALAGGYIATAAPAMMANFSLLDWGNEIFLVFATSGLLRLLITLWFIPKAVEPRVRRRPELLEIIFRVARINSISGVVLDWLTVTKKRNRKPSGDN
jgi:MFS family permease